MNKPPITFRLSESDVSFLISAVKCKRQHSRESMYDHDGRFASAHTKTIAACDQWESTLRKALDTRDDLRDTR